MPLDPRVKPLLEAYALALEYPVPGRLEELWRLWIESPRGRAKSRLEHFLRAVEDLSQEAWEELYTRTLDLTPSTAPYVGYAVYGESYARGEFMALLNRAYQELGLDPKGELPDHLFNILRYLAQAEAPLPQVLELLPQAVERMRQTLKTLDAKNPYLILLEGVLNLFQEVPVRR